MEKLTRASFKKKEVKDIPKGAKIISKEVSLSVEEIENGYLVLKSTEVKYKYDDRTEYLYSIKKWFSKDNPLEIDMKIIEDKSLADHFK